MKLKVITKFYLNKLNHKKIPEPLNSCKLLIC